MARRRLPGLERVLGANALFATAYGNVGSSIYYALGVTAVFALGLTPLGFVIAGLFVPHYLSIFWAPLKENPWDVIGGATVIAVLVALNSVGIQEAARLNIFLA